MEYIHNGRIRAHTPVEYIARFFGTDSFSIIMRAYLQAQKDNSIELREDEHMRPVKWDENTFGIYYGDAGKRAWKKLKDMGGR